MFEKNTLKNQTILITGGGSGLGLSMAHKFAELGADIAICGRTEKKLRNATEALKKHGTAVRYYPVDVREYEAVGEMFKSFIKIFGKLTGLVNRRRKFSEHNGRSLTRRI